MKKFALMLAAAGMVGFAGGAIADDHSNAGGTFDCTLVFDGDVGGVGDMMKYLRTRTTAESGNPKHIVDFYDDPAWDGTVAGLIFDKCGDPGNPS